jgi:EAL domain-containing protein (putative c-di-GMP-specific phosphodiesterase class I)
MTEQTKNSAEALIELRAALHKLDQSMTSGVNAESAKLAAEVARLAVTLENIVVDERCETLAKQILAHAERISA